MIRKSSSGQGRHPGLVNFGSDCLVELKYVGVHAHGASSFSWQRACDLTLYNDEQIPNTSAHELSSNATQSEQPDVHKQEENKRKEPKPYSPTYPRPFRHA